MRRWTTIWDQSAVAEVVLCDAVADVSPDSACALPKTINQLCGVEELALEQWDWTLQGLGPV